jgi:hypothetical protein
VEQAAQRAVRGLRIRHENRSARLANLAWRFELMTLDLERHEQTQAIGSFLTALGKLMLADGEMAAVGELSLQEPFSTILSAICAAGGQQEKQPAPEEPSGHS